MKLIRVNLSTVQVQVLDLPAHYEDLGGRGLCSMIVHDEVPPRSDALGPDNRLVFAVGLLGGTALANNGRLSIGAKSPLTGGIKESNVGGLAADTLARLGIAGVVCEGCAQDGKHWLLQIDAADQVRLVPADEFAGMRTYALVDRIGAEMGADYAVVCIGPAGEYGYHSASVQATDVDGRPCRAAGRGGLGAVMGSKGLKAIIVNRRGPRADSPVQDPESFRKAARVFARAVKDDLFDGYVLPPLGTAALVAPINAAGAFPSYNATRGVFEGWENLSGEKLAETIQQRGGKTTHQGCSRCVIHCSNEYVDRQGAYVTSSLEYETIWAMGGMCGIDDLDMVARCDFLCDDIGLDTMNTGVAIATAMDAQHIPFGDGQAVVGLLEEAAAGTQIGRVIGNGPAAVGRHFNHPRVAAVKNQSIAAYDPRAVQGMGVTYATSPMGADHTAGNVIDQNLQAFGGSLDPLKADGQVAYSRRTQIAVAVLDSLGLCIFVNSAINETREAQQAFLTLVSARLGRPVEAGDLEALGKRVLQAEISFNAAAGLTAADNRLPRFFHEEPLPPTNATFIVPDDELDQALVF